VKKIQKTLKISPREKEGRKKDLKDTVEKKIQNFPKSRNLYLFPKMIKCVLLAMSPIWKLTALRKRDCRG
jgi:hypothetical protein